MIGDYSVMDWATLGGDGFYFYKCGSFDFKL